MEQEKCANRILSEVGIERGNLNYEDYKKKVIKRMEDRVQKMYPVH